MSKPREFTLHQKQTFGVNLNEFFVYPTDDLDFSEQITNLRVIEKTAYDELLHKRNNPPFVIDDDGVVRPMLCHNHKLRYDKAVEALKYYCVEGLFDPIEGQRMDKKTARVVYELGETARETLKELGEL